MLSVIGGNSDSDWKWYENSCGGRFIGEGDKIEVSPTRSMTYYVRGEEGCDLTECLSVAVKVNGFSEAPSYIYVPSKVVKNENFTLTVMGGNLGEGADWKWYKNSCGGRSIGTGKSITIDAGNGGKFYVRAEGNCNSTTCAEAIVELVKEHKFHPYSSFPNYNNKFMHLGIGFGLDAMYFTGPESESQIFGLGLKGEFVYHPFIKHSFSFGLVSSYAIGTTPVWIVGGDRKNKKWYN